MGDRSAQLNLSATGRGDDAVVVDGQNISNVVRRVLLTAQAGEPPTLVLELAAHAFVVDAEGAHVGVSPVGEHILTQLGWMPPAEVERLTEALDSIGTAVETSTDDTLRGGIRSVLRRHRPEALEIWSELRASRQPEPPAADKPEMVPLLGHGGGHSRVPARPPRAQGSLATARQLLDQAIDDALPLAGGRVRELLAALRRELARVDAIRSTAPPTG